MRGQAPGSETGRSRRRQCAGPTCPSEHLPLTQAIQPAAGADNEATREDALSPIQCGFGETLGTTTSPPLLHWHNGARESRARGVRWLSGCVTCARGPGRLPESRVSDDGAAVHPIPFPLFPSHPLIFERAQVQMAAGLLLLETIMSTLSSFIETPRTSRKSTRT